MQQGKSCNGCMHIWLGGQLTTLRDPDSRLRGAPEARGQRVGIHSSSAELGFKPLSTQGENTGDTVRSGTAVAATPS